MTAPGESDLKRLRMRSWRRGTREMDLILGPFSDAELRGLAPAALAAYETLLSEYDQDLYLWVTGAGQAPEPLREVVEKVRAFHATKAGREGA